ETLDAVIIRALAPDRRARFGTARDLRAAIAAAVPAVADGDAVAAYLATLWRPDDPDRRAIKKLIAGEGEPTARISSPSLDRTTPIGATPATSAATVASSRTGRPRRRTWLLVG